MDIVLIFAFVVFYIGWALCNGLIAYEQGRGFFWWAFGSLTVSPLLVWLYLVASPSPGELNHWRTVEQLLNALYKQRQ